VDRGAHPRRTLRAVGKQAKFPLSRRGGKPDGKLYVTRRWRVACSYGGRDLLVIHGRTAGTTRAKARVSRQCVWGRRAQGGPGTQWLVAGLLAWRSRGLEERSRKPCSPSARKRSTHLRTVSGAVLNPWTAIAALIPPSATAPPTASRPFGVSSAFLGVSIRSSANHHPTLPTPRPASCVIFSLLATIRGTPL
jgi:hypothetical protein